MNLQALMILILHRRGFRNCNNECVKMKDACVCFAGHGVLPDAVRAGGGDPVQAGA